MPLLNHFSPPPNVTHPWRGFHSAWATIIAQHLNDGILPSRFYAMPNIELGGPVEIDVATLKEGAGDGNLPRDGATALWTPPAAAVTVPVEFPPLDLVEVQVIENEEGPRLIAAIELVSPSNKDRPAHRRAFTIKCASYLNEGACVVMVDAVTNRRWNLHSELMRILDLDSSADWQSPTQLYANAYRSLARDDTSEVQMWHEPLTLGLPLPCLPLWLGIDFAVPLNLEQSYTATCHDMRIRMES